jgi:hypothetical protein
MKSDMAVEMHSPDLTSEASVATGWAALAKAWSEVAWPFRPTGSEIRMFESSVRDWARQSARERIQALILGVTPEIALMNWPANTYVTGVDNSPDVIRAIWPGDAPNVREAICANWLSIPRSLRSLDVIIGDGSLIAFRFPQQTKEIVRRAHALLRADGLLVLRCYTQSSPKESVQEVFHALSAGEIPTINHFKFRLFMAVQRDAEEGAPVKDIYRAWANNRIESDVLTQRFKWTRAAIDTMEFWRDGDTVYTFPTLQETLDVLQEHFEICSLQAPQDGLGQRCPIVVATPK